MLRAILEGKEKFIMETQAQIQAMDGTVRDTPVMIINGEIMQRWNFDQYQEADPEYFRRHKITWKPTHTMREHMIARVNRFGNLSAYAERVEYIQI
jgi:hypothetical protein